MKWNVCYDSDEKMWKVEPEDTVQTPVFSLSIKTESDSCPLLVKENELTRCNTPQPIKRGEILALDEAFSIELVGENDSNVVVNDDGKNCDEFNEMFKGGASEVGEDGDRDRGRAFGLYSIKIAGIEFAPLLIEIYPGYKIGYHYKGKKESCPAKRYKETRNFFQAMIDKLAESDLVLSLLDPATLRSSSGGQDRDRATSRTKLETRTPMTDYWFFVKHADSIKKALKHIQRFPHKVLGQKKEYRRIDAITFYDSDLPYEIAKAPQYLQPLASPNKRGVCEKNGKRFLPEQVVVNMLEETYDNPENRFLLHIVNLFLSKIRNVEKWLQKRLPESQENTSKYIKDIERLGKELASFKRHPDFRPIRRSPLEPSQSKVLIKTPGYREMALIWRQYGGLDFNAGLLLLDTIIRQKKWHDLYELYCLILLCEKIGSKFERTSQSWSTDRQNKKNEEYLTASFCFKYPVTNPQEAYILLFNHTFTRKPSSGSENDFCRIDENLYEMPKGTATGSNNENNIFRPDYVLFKQQDRIWKSYYLMDAKFMIAGNMPDFSVEKGGAQINPNGFQGAVSEIAAKYINGYNENDTYLLYGCGIFLKGDSSDDDHPKTIIKSNTIIIEGSCKHLPRFCIAAAVIDTSNGVALSIECERCKMTKGECCPKIFTVKEMSV